MEYYSLMDLELIVIPSLILPVQPMSKHAATHRQVEMSISPIEAMQLNNPVSFRSRCLYLR